MGCLLNPCYRNSATYTRHCIYSGNRTCSVQFVGDQLEWVGSNAYTKQLQLRLNLFV